MFPGRPMVFQPDGKLYDKTISGLAGVSVIAGVVNLVVGPEVGEGCAAVVTG